MSTEPSLSAFFCKGDLAGLTQADRIRIDEILTEPWVPTEQLSDYLLSLEHMPAGRRRGGIFATRAL
ncbi:hypothetical protein LOC54_08880 [Acetobacter sp. AN02]|uniref:hypothetical protein n=1 Tax=Acetobacter sp. AN02 TaxID=2894186 RepID=UPI0024343D0A|nr:hypothetical protein [Acetobacter sp. AN02]MDG6095215.1 hypothetical protein [Acetobacter sp. AN02]